MLDLFSPFILSLVVRIVGSLVVELLFCILDSRSNARVLFSFFLRYKILRRRIIWMTGQWINVKVSRQTRPVVYRVYLKLMNAQEDLVVRDHKINVFIET